MTAAAARVQLWHGPDVAEGAAAYTRAIDAGFSELKARVYGSIASWKDCWTLQSTLAKFHRCSVRTVQRAARDARELGYLRCAWCKKGETPPGASGPMPFKWCHRWVPGRGLAGAALEKAVSKARALWAITKAGKGQTFNAPQSSKPRPKPRKPPPHLTREQRARWIDEQIATEPEPLRLDEREPKPPE